VRLNGSEILVECLKEQGVEVVFGYPGGTILNIYDALYRHSGEIKHYLTAHEQGAAHAADGYARATGRVGVCMATSGPGATNLVTGIATAYMDSSPVVAITVNVALPLLGKDTFQEVDIAGVTMPITKHNYIVKDVNDLADTIRNAFRIAQTGRRGPVLIDITKDVTIAQCDYTPKTPDLIPSFTRGIRDADIDEAIKLIAESEKPLVYGGGGIIAAGASERFREFTGLIGAPVTLSLMGLGSYPGSGPLYCGMLGMHGTVASNLTATNCDLFIAVGARFSDRAATNAKNFAPNAKVLHIDIDPAEINKNVTAYRSVVGDANEILKRLNEKLREKGGFAAQNASWLATVDQLKRERPISYAKDGVLRPQYVIERISELAGTDAVIVTEVGQHQMFATQFLDIEKPRHFISSGGLGTMGFGLGASIGAKIGCPDKTVINIAGDGCFRMNNIELATAVEYNVHIIEIIINNHTLGMVRQWQSLFYDKRYSHTTLSNKLDMVKLAEAHGAAAFNVTEPSQVDGAILKALSMDGPVVINCEVGMDDNVIPMVPAGKSNDEVIFELID